MLGIGSIFVMFLSMAQIIPAIDREVYIIPVGYVGPIVIIYDVPDGKEEEQDSEGAIVFRIPASGVLRLKRKHPGPGVVAVRYYYEAADGTRSRILADLDDKTVLQAFSNRDGFTGVIDGHEIKKRWRSFIVGVPDSDTKWWEGHYKLVNDALLQFVPAREESFGKGGP